MFLAGRDSCDGASRRLLPPAPSAPAPSMPPPDAYVKALLLAELLGVHALSPALEFRPHAPLAADANAWWRTLQQRSITSTQRRRRQAGAALPDALAELANSASEGNGADTAHQLLEAHADALVRVLQTLDRVNRRRPSAESGAEAVLGTADDAVAFAAARLLESWEATTATTTTAPHASVFVVNVLLQFCGVGTLHTFHPHVLVASAARRVFSREASWKCATCSRLSEVKGPAAVPLVFRCAACDFNLCRECFTRIPNASALHGGADSTHALLLPQVPERKLQIARFFQLAFRGLGDSARFNTVAWQLAFELRRRVKELPIYRTVEAATSSALLVDMLAHPAFALQVVQHAESDWFPVYMNTWMMGFPSFLGPFLCGTTMTDELRGPTLDGPAAAAAAAVGALGSEWQAGFRALKRQFMAIMRALLATTQHPYVVHATLCWLGCTVLSTTKRRRLNRETNDSLDGFLLNVSTVLVLLSLPSLDADARAPGLLDASYHVGLLSRRAFGDKNVREAPLRDLASIRGEPYVRAKERAEVERVRAHDRACVQRYAAELAGSPRSEAATGPTAFYPLRDAHYGVACNHCYQQNFRGVRYKCAFCDDIDICAGCFALFCRQSESARGRIDGVLTTGLGSPQVHMLDHVFLRVGTPVPLYETRHFEVIKFEKAAFRAGPTPDESSEALACADCGGALAAAGVAFKCSNCFDPRFVCAACVAREERPGDPHRMHYSPLAPALQYLSLSHPSALLPRTAANLETELLYMAIKSLHYGPLLTLSKLIGILKEMHDLQAFCYSEEQQLAYETQQRRADGDSDDRATCQRPLKLSSHYSVGRSRLADLDAKNAVMELHLLEISSRLEYHDVVAALSKPECGDSGSSNGVPSQRKVITNVLSLGPLTASSLSSPSLASRASNQLSVLADKWRFSGLLVRDGKLVLAHLVVLVVRCAGLSDQCPSSSFWKLVHESGSAMLQGVGDLDTRARWTLNAATTRLEAAQFLGETTADDESATDDGSSQDDETLLLDDDDGDELNEDDALALLEKQAADAGTAAARATASVVDRSVIERHLLSAQHVDPFTREPLTVEMLVPCDALRREIRLYLQAKLRQFQSAKAEDVLATWGLGWNCLFDSDGDVAASSDES
ncbi:hypothetical protein PybrP1_007599 [[Pythium] brassicae (nom. inval.)]|nr:hypothetical protein PybrP1_007599 [[Pythium] brassicae (nom. inval.)]